MQEFNQKVVMQYKAMLVAVLLRCTNRLLLGCTKLYILR